MALRSVSIKSIRCSCYKVSQVHHPVWAHRNQKGREGGSQIEESWQMPRRVTRKAEGRRKRSVAQEKKGALILHSEGQHLGLLARLLPEKWRCASSSPKALGLQLP